MDFVARLSSKILLDPASGCWEWQASTRGPTPEHQYGQVRVAGRVLDAHRVIFELVVGPVPAGLVLDHLCRNTRCVNPGHLEPVTQRENVLRGTAPAALNARKTTCAAGHELVVVGSRRRCRTCRSAS